MSILGTLIDKQTVSRAGDAGTTSQRVGLATLGHSLPATNPEAVFMLMRSVEGVAGVAQTPRLFALGGNASILTIGYEYQSGVSAGTILYDVIAAVFHSVIR